MVYVVSLDMIGGWERTLVVDGFCAKMSPPLSGHRVALLNALCVMGSMIFLVLFAAWQNCP